MERGITVKCPKCGSKRVAPILYGMPAYDEELERKINSEEVYLGGCIISGSDPQYHCFGCGKDIGSPPVFLSLRGEEDYREIVTSIRFSDGGFFSGHREIWIGKKADKIMVEVRSASQEPAVFMQREAKPSEWARLLDRLYCKVYLHEWKKRYIDPDVLDGEQWELEVKLTGGRVRNYCGSNAFPPYWAELNTAFRPFFREAGITI